ncbi:hypothetical protein ACFL43_06245 [Thermodesulfobacteriota bacterium]
MNNPGENSLFMDDAQITSLLMRVADHVGRLPGDSREVFATLIATTLSYRDRIKEQQGVVVTIGDVRAALDQLTEALQTRRLPRSDNRLQSGLVKLWLDALKPYV